MHVHTGHMEHHAGAFASRASFHAAVNFSERLCLDTVSLRIACAFSAFRFPLSAHQRPHAGGDLR